MKEIDVPRLSTMMMKLAISASGNLGSDCYCHATLPIGILARLGIPAKLVVGHAAWRVGEGDSDVIIHAPHPNVPQQPGGVAYHAWIEIEDNLLDFTTYQLRAKAAHLDSLDGGVTRVEWCPNYLFAHKNAVSDLLKVINLNAGRFYYKREPELEDLILRTAPEDDDLEVAWTIYQNQDIRVLGLNDMRRHDE